MSAEAVLLARTATCWLCGDSLRMAVGTAADEYVWVDAAGSTIGTDKDLRGLVNPATGERSADGRLAWLRAELERGHRECKRKAEHMWLYWERAREYSMLKVRLEMGGTFHVHHVSAGDLVPWEGPVPEHCGQPMWLRPSGWHCRAGCGERRP